ncbi:MAG: ribosome biogenesis GTPase Der [Nitrospinota bacterium]|nr:ribosome biogenesis GTPase Der [Nitrospinota bacterium]
MFYIAIVGRPNVGKSTLFNRIIGGRPAIVDDTPGVTRDRNIGFSSRLGRKFGVIDTGGFEPENQNDIVSQTREQALVAVEEADEIFFVVDGREGPAGADEELGRMLRKAGKRVWLVVNKVDNPSAAGEVDQFHRMGFENVRPVSAEHALGVEGMLEEIVAAWPKDPEDEEDGGKITRIAVVGKPNVGKSSLINRIVGKGRMIVSQTAGTTRDAVDSEVTLADGRRYILIDTAGIRRKSKVSQKLEKYSVIMAMKAVERADVALLLADASEGVTTQEAKIAGMVEDAGKGLILVVNKWDLVQKDTNSTRVFEAESREKLKFARHAPMVFISSLTGQRVEKVWDMVDEVGTQLAKRIGSGALNAMVRRIMQKTPPPTAKGRMVKVYFVTQVSTSPPTIVIMANMPENIHFSYRRHLENRIREEAGLDKTPMRFIFRRPSGRRQGDPNGKSGKLRRSR